MKQQKRVKKIFGYKALLGLEVALAEGDMARAGGSHLAAYAERDLLDFAAGGEEFCSLGFNGVGGKIA